MGGEVPEIRLGGRHEPAFEPLVGALDDVKRMLRGRRFALVGGLGVAVRLAVPERATADLDNVVEAPRSGPGAVALLVAGGMGVEPVSDYRVTVNGVTVDLIDAYPSDHDDPAFLPRDDALFQTASRYALDTASTVRVVAGERMVEVGVGGFSPRPSTSPQRNGCSGSGVGPLAREENTW